MKDGSVINGILKIDIGVLFKIGNSVLICGGFFLQIVL
jgi:hypothetical protein